MAGKNISIDRCFEDAEGTGVLDLCCRNLKEFPDISEDCELIDVIECDISKNRFTELPLVVCELVMLERLNCHHNNIRYIPDSSQLTSLTWLNLSRNQLPSLPDHICGLPLKVLIVSNNKLSSIPDDIRLLKHIQYLDLSCNELKTLPHTLGELSSLRELNIRRNNLEELPDEMCKLKLVKLDISCNRITIIPTLFRFLTTLTNLVLDNNPLQSPPAQLCTRGRGHIFKYLAITAQMQEKGKDANSKYNSSKGNTDSILTEAILLSGKAVVDIPKKKSPSDQKPNDKVTRSTTRRSTLLEAELVRTKQLLVEEQKLDSTGFDDEKDGKSTSVKKSDDDIKLREASRKLQIQREKQRENARQKHLEAERRGNKAERPLPKRKVHAGNKKATNVVKIVGNDNKSSVVKKVEITENVDDLRDSRKEAQLSTKKIESERKKIRRESDADKNSDSDPDKDNNSEQDAPFPGINKRSKIPISAYSSVPPNFTVRRMYNSAREQFEKVELLREAIESRLKVKLPDDIPACLADGTVLCHLVNYFGKGTIPTIFVPTSNMPKLTMSKCLKNVDHFLSACLKLGVERDKLCNPADIVQEKNPGNVWITVDALLVENQTN